MNKVGIYYAYWTRDWDADFVPFVSKVKALGFDVLEVNSGTVTNMSDAQRDRLKIEAARCGVELTFCIGLTAEYDLAGPDTAVRRNGIDFLKRQARMLRYMEAKELGGIIYGAWPGRLPDGGDKRACLDRSVAGMKEVMKVAEDCDVTFHVEVVNRFEQFLLNTAAEAVEYVERVGSPHCRILLDTFHMNIEEDSFRGAILTAGDKLGHLHIGETNRKAPGRGKIPWDEVFAALKEIDYAGSIVMEPFLQTGGEVGRDISVFRDLRGDLDLDDEARRACSLVKEKLNAAHKRQ
jgi:D-psicose/D-tagatose/L-ribulose 3-epimerase